MVCEKADKKQAFFIQMIAFSHCSLCNQNCLRFDDAGIFS